MGSPTDAPRPGAGLVVTEDGTPTDIPHLDAATVDLVRRHLLVGGEPGRGKSGLHNLAVVHAVLDADDDGSGAGEG